MTEIKSESSASREWAAPEVASLSTTDGYPPPLRLNLTLERPHRPTQLGCWVPATPTDAELACSLRITPGMPVKSLVEACITAGISLSFRAGSAGHA
jgi:hypothetical protein